MHDTAEAVAEKVQLVGGLPPLLPELAELMPPAPALIDQLASEFAPTAASLSTPQAYWDGLNGWMTDRLSGSVLEGTLTADACRGGSMGHLRVQLLGRDGAA